MSEQARELAPALEVSAGHKRPPYAAMALVAAGAVAAAIGLVMSPSRTWLNLLVNGFYALTLGVAAMFFFSTQRLANARWSAPLRRIVEALALTLPAAAILLLVLSFGATSVYSWADGHGAAGGHGAAAAHDAAAAHGATHATHAPVHAHIVDPGRDTYLSPMFVYLRMAAVLLIWCFFAWRLRVISRAGDRDSAAGMATHRRLGKLSAIFTPLFAFTFTAAAYDWIISLDPDWFSTMFAVYVFAGAFVQGIAAITLAAAVLHRRGSFTAAGRSLRVDQLHDLGKMLFAFSTFWAYIWVCQYLLIWYGNIPEEVTYYLRRTCDAWLPLFLVNFAINWAVPFFALLPVAAKRDPKRLITIASLVLFGHWLDLYLMVFPSRHGEPSLGALELAMFAGTAALLYLIFRRGLGRAPLLPPYDPLLAQRPGADR